MIVDEVTHKIRSAPTTTEWGRQERRIIGPLCVSAGFAVTTFNGTYSLELVTCNECLAVIARETERAIRRSQPGQKCVVCGGSGELLWKFSDDACANCAGTGWVVFP